MKSYARSPSGWNGRSQGEERAAQTGVALREAQVAGLEPARFGAEDLDDCVSLPFGPAGQVGDQVEHWREIREDAALVRGPSPRAGTEGLCDSLLRGRLD